MGRSEWILMTFVDVQELRKRYGVREALAGVSLRAPLVREIAHLSRYGLNTRGSGRGAE